MRRIAALALLPVVLASTLLTASPAIAAVPGEFESPSQLLDELRVAAPVTSGYDRDLFPLWDDADSDGCDTRSELLIAHSSTPAVIESGCAVSSGEWLSWYDGAVWTNPSDVDIDHLVALSEAWQSGADAWTATERRSFANDLDWGPSLQVITDNVNQSKGDADPAHWLPSLPEAQCRYAQDWVTVKYRWSLAVDPEEKTALQGLLSGECGAAAVVVPDVVAAAPVPPAPPTQPTPPAPPQEKRWPLYKLAYSSTIYELVTDENGSQTPVPLSFEKWRDVYHLAAPKPKGSDFVKYPWSPTGYAVTFWPGGESAWQWTALTYGEWRSAGFPAFRIAGWIKGSYYYKWGTSPDILVEGADGINHRLTANEWRDSGYRPFVNRANEGFMKLTWTADIVRFSDISAGTGRPIRYAEWAEEGLPNPKSVRRMPGDQVYRYANQADVWYAGPAMNRVITFAEWTAMGRPAPRVIGTDTPPTSPPPPSNGGGGGGGGGSTRPADRDCKDFRTQAQAQAFYDQWYPLYGDFADLDGNDNDHRVCESLP